jgi:small-conductance mechanosensitive channel
MVDFRAILINLYNLLHSITFSVGETTISIISILQVIICLLLVLVLTHYFNLLGIIPRRLRRLYEEC